MSKVTFEIDQEILEEFNELAEILNERYPDEPFDKDAFIQSKIKEFNKQQKQFLSFDGYNKSK